MKWQGIRIYKGALLAACFSGAWVASSAGAQTTTGTAVNADQSDSDIVVTAERRKSTVQDTPLAITAVSGAELDRSGVSNLDTLQRLVPSLTLGDGFGLARTTIRGVSTENVLGGSIGGDPGVSYSVNGITLARPQSASAEIYDVDRIEVLRGPQGTLYGRNATGGAINVITAAPTDTFSGYADVLGGSRAHVRLRGAISGPLADGIAFRVAGFGELQDGFIRNLSPTGDQNIGNKRHWGVRGTLRADLGTNVTVNAFADYYYRDNQINPFVTFPNIRGVPGTTEALGGRYGTDLRTVNYDFRGSQDYRRIFTTGATIDVRLGGVTLTSVTGYSDSRFNNAFDLDGASVAYLETRFRRNTAEQFSQELRLASNDAGPFHWVIGGYYFHERAQNQQQFAFVPFGANFNSGGRVSTESFAAFGQADYAITSRLKLIGGVRWTQDQKEGSEYFDFIFVGPRIDSPLPRQTWRAVTPRFAIEYKPTADILLYASATRGFKSGGFNVGALQAPYRPEYIWSYEAGIKSDLFDRKLRANLSIFRYDYSDQQFNQIIGLLATLTNASSTRAYGGELELLFRPTKDIQIGANYAYLHARFRQFLTQEDPYPELGVQNLAGNTLPRSPDHSVSLFGQARIEGPAGFDFTPRAEVKYTSRTYLTEFNRTFSSQGPVALLNASLGVTKGPFYGNVFVNNITDRIVINNSQITAAVVGFTNALNVGEPRTFGVQLGVKF